MSRRRRLLTAATLAIVPLGATLATSSSASADTVCTPYTETTGGCIQQWYDENGTFHTTLFFYWGNSWVEIPLS